MKKGERWYIDYYMPHPLKGHVRKRKWISNKLATRQRLAFARAFIAEVKGRLAGEQVPDTVGLVPAIDNVHQQRINSVQAVSGRQYKAAMNHFHNFLQKYRLQRSTLHEFAPLQAANFADYLQGHHFSDNTYNLYLSLIRGYFQQLVDLELIAKNPFRSLKMRKASSRQKSLLTPRQYALYLEYLAAHYPHLYRMATLIRATLIRVKELLHIKAMDVDLDRQLILIGGAVSKNKKSRQAVIPSSILPELDMIRDIPGDYYLFGPKGMPGNSRPMSRNTIEWQHRQALDAVGLAYTGFTLYANKHLGAYQMVQQGVSPLAIKQQAGHYSVATTEVYLRTLYVDKHIYNTLKNL